MVPDRFWEILAIRQVFCIDGYLLAGVRGATSHDEAIFIFVSRLLHRPDG
jgi:hypothetical protein